MLNLIKSIVITFITVILTVLNFLKGPLLIGLVVGASIMAFASDASAATTYPIYQCNHVSCTAWEMMSFSQHMAVGAWVLSCVLLFVLLNSSRKEQKIRKSEFQVELDAAIKTSLSKGNK